MSSRAVGRGGCVRVCVPAHAAAAETCNRIDSLRREVRAGLAARLDADQVHRLVDRKVDWERLQDVVGTFTDKTVGDYVKVNVDRIHREVEARITRIFEVDPTMRADMQARHRSRAMQ